MQWGKRATARLASKLLGSSYGERLINKKDAPAEWVGLMYELEDAQEHLAALIAEMNAADDFDEVELRVQLAHVFSHLNRAWYRRDKVHDLSEDEWLNASKFPSDLDPIEPC